MLMDRSSNNIVMYEVNYECPPSQLPLPRDQQCQHLVFILLGLCLCPMNT